MRQGLGKKRKNGWDAGQCVHGCLHSHLLCWCTASRQESLQKYVKVCKSFSPLLEPQTWLKTWKWWIWVVDKDSCLEECYLVISCGVSQSRKMAFQMESSKNRVQKYESSHSSQVFNSPQRPERKWKHRLFAETLQASEACRPPWRPLGLGQGKSARVWLICEFVGCKFNNSSWLSTSTAGN